MLEFAKKEKTRELTERRKNLEARLAKAREEEERIKRDFEQPGRPRKKQV
jgi:chromosome transmission fidelity protein 1